MLDKFPTDFAAMVSPFIAQDTTIFSQFKEIYRMIKEDTNYIPSEDFLYHGALILDIPKS